MRQPWSSPFSDGTAAMGPNRPAQERERAQAERRAIADPTIGAAVEAGFPWLSFSCPACGQFSSVDLRLLDWHEDTAISTLIRSVSCECSPNAPFAKPEMLTAERQ
jgi:hypothetical protein